MTKLLENKTGKVERRYPYYYVLSLVFQDQKNQYQAVKKKEYLKDLNPDLQKTIQNLPVIALSKKLPLWM